MGGRAGPAQEALGIISITTCVFLSSHLFVCLSVSIPLAKPISTWVNEAGQIGPPSHSTPTSSAPPIHSVPQSGHQKPMTWWVSNLRAARAPLGLWGPALGLPQIRVWRQSWEWPKDSLPSARPEALAGADCALGVLSRVHSRRRWPRSCSPGRGRNSGTDSRSDRGGGREVPAWETQEPYSPPPCRPHMAHLSWRAAGQLEQAWPRAW